VNKIIEPPILYIYDGSFEGWLTTVGMAKSHPGKVQNIVADDVQQDLFSEKIFIETDEERAERIFKYLCQNYPEDIVMDVLYAFLSETEGIELQLFYYLIRLWAKGEQAVRNYTDETMATVQQARERVAHEILRMQGFVRFRKLKSGVYYAPISPDADVVQMLAPHFSARFSDQPWVIHDTKRNTGIYYDGAQCRYLYSIEIPEGTVAACRGRSTSAMEVFASGEGDLQELWKQYCQAVAIQERINPRLQRQRMPVRYWKYLVEK
jgi:probable DNA metabolism protein